MVKDIVLPAYSSLFRAMKGLILLREGYSFRVRIIKKDDPPKDLNIKRLKRLIFNEIQIMFNRRIMEYNLTYPPLEDIEIGNLDLGEIIVNAEQESEGKTGEFELYPMAFVCDTCGDFRLIFNKRELENFRVSKCLIEECNGKYHQLSLVRFCRDCGKIEPFIYWCDKDTQKEKAERFKEHPIRLVRPSRDTLYGWAFECRTCSTTHGKKPKDIFTFKCDHVMIIGNEKRKISNKKEKTPFDPLTIREGSVFQPVVKTFVNVEPILDEGEDLDGVAENFWLAVGYHLGLFNQMLGEELSLGDLKNRIESFRRLEMQLPPRERETIRKSLKIDEILEIIEDLRRTAKYSSNKNIDEFLTVKGITVFNSGGINIYSREVKNFEEYLEREVTDEEKRENLRKEFNRVRSELKVRDIIYVPEIKLVSAYIGYINGPYTRERAPHFEPLWTEKTLREGKQFYVSERTLEAYLYPYSTEGIVIELDPHEVAEWLYNIGYIKMKVSSQEEALKKLIFLNEDIPEDRDIMDTVVTLLHTLAHAFIMNASKYSGLDIDSFGELLFPAATSFLIYSTSVINIGGLQYLFENNLIHILEDVKEHIQECIYDPVCISEEGACFACMYLPEYVCGYFNQNLDRRIFTTSDSRGGFWQ